MATVTFEKAEITRHIVKSDKRMLYVIQDTNNYLVVDPYMCRVTSTHSSLEDAVSVASCFVDY